VCFSANKGCGSVFNNGATPDNAIAGHVTFVTANGTSISSISPSAANAGDPAFTLTVNGTGFQSGITVLWNGSPISTTFVSATQVTASVPASLIASAGSASVTVENTLAAPSNALTFTINPPSTLSLTSLSPNSATVGGAAFTLTANGTGFVNGSTVLWNGAALTTSFVSVTQLTASVPASLIAAQGSASVSVQNGSAAPSNALTFSINLSSTLSVSSLSPNTAAVGGAAFTMTVNGAGFVSGCAVLWNGAALATTFISSTQVSAAVAANLIATIGSANVAVQNPGGATSNALTFTIGAVTAGPTLTSLSPNSTAPGGPAFTLTVTGTGFLSGAVVQWNGSALSTGFLGNATQLTALVPANLIANPGVASVTVVNPGAVASNALTFTIASLGLPHFQVGGGFVMSFYVLNSGNQPGSFTINFNDDTGHPLAIPFTGLSTTASLSDTIGANGAKYYESGSYTAPALAGSAVISASQSITIHAFLRRLGSDGSYYEAAIPATIGYNELQIPFDATIFAANGSQIFTGFAILNLDPVNSANVVCTARDSVGNLIPNAVSLPALNALGHFAGYLFPALNNLRGTLDCSSNTKIAAVALHTIGANSISSFPIIPIR
jgi:hypothetical protein